MSNLDVRASVVNCKAGVASAHFNPKVNPQHVYIGRPSKWGNPYSHLGSSQAPNRVFSRAEAIAMYQWWITQPEQDWLFAAAQHELAGKVLGCWCKPKSCHGDILAAIANGELTKP